MNRRSNPLNRAEEANGQQPSGASMVVAPQAPAKSEEHEEAATPQGDEQTRHEVIAAAAYFLAESRGFSPGCELDDWLRAEAQIAAKWSPPGAQG